MKEQRKKSFLWRHWKGIVNIVTLLGLVVLIFAIRDELVTTLQNLKQVNYWILLLMLPIQFLNYDAQVRIYKGIFEVEKKHVGYWNLMRATLELNFVNHVFPSGGVTGISYFSLRLKRNGVRAAQTTAVHMIKLVLIFLSFELLIALAVVTLAIGGHINNLILLIAGSLVTSVILFTLGFAVVLGSKKRISGFFSWISKALNHLLKLFRKDKADTLDIARVKEVVNDMHEHYRRYSSDWSKLKWPFFWAFMATFWEIMTIYIVYVAFGEFINIGAIILAYAIANSAGFVSVLPGGVGIYEGLMTLVLSATGVPSRLSLPVTIMYRVLNTIIQVPPGYVAYHLFLKGLKPEEKQRLETSNASEEGRT